MKTKKKQRTPKWFFASVLERFERHKEDRRRPRRKCIAHENWLLIRAKSGVEAYRKAIRFGKLAQGTENIDSCGRKGEWIFVGVRELVPVYDKLEDGAELLWIEHIDKSVATIKALVPPKNKLAVFLKMNQRANP